MSDSVPTRRRLLLPLLVIGFILISVAEVWLLTAVASRITVLATLAILIAEAVVGAWLLRHEGSKAWKALLDAYGTGRLPSGQLADAALVLVGGVLLILPGFFTDLIGLVCLIPATRPFARRVLGALIARHAARSGIDIGVIRAKYGEGTVIPGETVDDPESPPPTDDPRTIRGELED